jgi:hypothetical protein
LPMTVSGYATVLHFLLNIPMNCRHLVFNLGSKKNYFWI